MLTYVINTSENKTFDSNLLFELVGYSQIRWKHCSLDKIDLCANEICEEEKSKILSTGEYRVVVLVDFFGFPYTDSATEEAAGAYVEIYKGFLEHYLMENLFGTLKQNNIPAKDCEIYYIQYVPHEPLSVNYMEAEQTATLFGLHGGEIEKLRAARKAGEKDLLQGVKDCPKYKEFLLPCSNGVELRVSFSKKAETENEEGMTFGEFFRYFCEHRDDPRKFGIVVHKPYVTYGDAGRAAYDALSLSLYLVYLYERRDEVPPDTEIRRPDNRVFIQTLRSSLRKVHSARASALKNVCKYHSLDVEGQRTFVNRDSESSATAQKAKKEVRLTEKEQYRQICRLAGGDDSASMPELQDERNHLMKSYLDQRDFARSKEKEEQKDELDESKAELLQCPSDIDYKKATERKRKKIAELLEKSLQNDGTMQTFEKEKEDATAIYGAYKKAKACQARNIIGDVVMLIIMLAAMIIPYGMLQFSGKPFSGISMIMYVIAVAMFGGLYLALFLWHLVRSASEIRRQSSKLNLLYRQCMEKRNKSFDFLRTRYLYDLVEIEELRKDLWEIEKRYETNREKNRHVEMHREMLEMVENQLSGMLNNFGEKPDISIMEDVRDEFKIEKPITAAENRIYKIFSMDAIDAMFKQKGEEVL